MADIQIVVFSLNNEICGADAEQIHEIVRYQNISSVPEMPDFVEGVINLRGRVVPIVNLNKRFGLGDTDLTKKTKIIVTEINTYKVGYIVNDVSEIIKLSQEDMEAPPDIIQKVGNSYLKYVGKKGEQLIAILDLGKILNDAEVEKIDSIEA